MRRGITLVEVIVVAAIVLILAAITLRVTVQARQRAQFATCMSNLKSIYQASVLYSADHADLLPTAMPCDSVSIVWCSPERWRTAMEPYVGSKDPFYCPADSYRNVAPPPMRWDSRFTSYSAMGIVFLFEKIEDEPVFNGSLSTYKQSSIPFLQDMTILRDGKFRSLHGDGRTSTGLFMDGSVKVKRWGEP
jgi:prepilin-type N-terminal cleavage/methylation domain-containing protein